jgi:hypothetical protein
MANYRWVTLVFPPDTVIRTPVEEQEVNLDLQRLQIVYGVKVKMGRRLSKDEAAHLERVQSQRIASRKGAAPARPLSPDFGRGSGAPV